MMKSGSANPGRVVIFGNGRSGAAAAALLRREGAEVVVLEGEAPFPEGDFDFAVTSPGIALDHAWQCAARARGVRVISELQLGAAWWRAHGGRMLAVTGSKGKSSVVKLVADTLTLAGQPAVPCGNYGTPLAAICVENDACANERCGRGRPPGGPPRPSGPTVAVRAEQDVCARPWAVVEVSSFQLETTDLPADAFAAAALLNLQDDHLDRHGSREVYHALKRRLLAMTRVAIDHSAVAQFDPAAPTAPFERFDALRPLFAGSYFDNPVLAANGAAAVKLLRAAGLADDAVAAGFAAFRPLPHRMAFVCRRDGVDYIDDSKATSLAALCAGVAMVAGFRAAGAPPSPPRCRLIAGGLAKGDNPNFAIPLLSSGVKKVYLIGRCAPQLYDAWAPWVPCEMCGTLEHAVAAARRDAESGEAVLLSPGTASFDQFKSYSERGDRFAALAREERKNEG